MILYMESPDIYLLQSVKWDFFGSFTFRSERLPERVRLGMWFALERKIAQWHSVSALWMPWALRQEPGEIGFRLHFHALIGGVPSYAVTETKCMAIMAQWEKLGGGYARCRIFDRGRNAPEYILKCLSDHEGVSRLEGKDIYESSKFGASRCHLMLAKSVYAINATNARRDLSRIGAGVGRVRPRLGEWDIAHRSGYSTGV